MAAEDPQDDEGPLHHWAVTYLATVSKTVVVQARGFIEATDLADKQFEQPSLCHQCAREMDISDWFPGENESSVEDEGPVGG